MKIWIDSPWKWSMILNDSTKRRISFWWVQKYFRHSFKIHSPLIKEEINIGTLKIKGVLKIFSWNSKVLDYANFQNKNSNGKVTNYADLFSIYREDNTPKLPTSIGMIWKSQDQIIQTTIYLGWTVPYVFETQPQLF